MDADQRLHEQANAAADSLLRLLGISTPEDLRDGLVDIATYRGADVRFVGLDGLAGRIVPQRNGRSLITINSRDTLERRRFSLAHELGHHELHARLNQTFACTARDMTDYRRSPEERQANYFAACLLMPDWLFADEVDDHDPSVALVQSVASRFGTSRMATALRLSELSDRRTAVVLSAADGVRWAIPNQRFGYAVDRRLPRLSPLSFAHDALRGAQVPTRPSKVDGDTWLYFDLRSGEDLMESSMLLGGTGLALTVLWVRER